MTESVFDFRFSCICHLSLSRGFTDSYWSEVGLIQRITSRNIYCYHFNLGYILLVALGPEPESFGAIIDREARGVGYFICD